MPDNDTAPCCSDGCCSSPAPTDTTTKPADMRDTVREGYAQIARSGQWSSVTAAPTDASCGAGGGCCGPTTLTPDQVAQAVGYAHDELSAIPQGANMGLSCGNPTALASLKPGETLLDLGSGAGFDCFIAGPRVGAAGHVIGVDMTPDMLTKARRGLDAYRRHSGLDNVEFRLGEIENLPAPDASVDVVISNCVLNLSPDKPRVWREIARVLKPAGRVAISDLALLKPLPSDVTQDVEALIGCVAGACLIEQLRADAQAAGLVDIQLVSKPEYIAAMTHWQDPLYKGILDRLPQGASPSDYITSLDIRATRPA